MQPRKYIQIGWILLLTVFISALAVTSVSAASYTARHIRTYQGTTPLNANIYLTTGTLAPIFQSRINQQVPNALSNAIANVVNKLPAADRGWASTMAATVIQPSATLTNLAPQQGGLAASLRLSLYPGDPKPINAIILIKFSVIDSSTIQVSAQPLAGSPALVNGPITTFHIPIGQLNSIAATPSCGDSALVANLQVPVSLGQAQTPSQGQQVSTDAGVGIMQQPSFQRAKRDTAMSGNSYVEIPSASLASLGSSIGTLPINNSLSAQNIRVAVQGSYLVTTSDVILDNAFKIGTAVTTLQPEAINGGLAVHVLNTKLTVFQIFTFPYDSYNAQIEQNLNSKLGGVLAGKFIVSNAAIGANSHVPCAAGDSLVLTGTTGLV